ncbi:hypothetical protein [uncultured Microbacterium sp.]|uniref:hypothetical protein n=1 Tax=uncultured Microbacterium sp. TaxID=191216 RepID=UPI0028EC0E46|nr:hypothetical protein [uncultured Microbacterium sp.]
MNYITNNDGISQIGDPLEDAIQDELATRTESDLAAGQRRHSSLIREARDHADHYRRYDDTESLVSTLVEMANALDAEPQVTFADRLSARSDYELGRMAGRDEIRAELEERKKNGVWVEHAGHCNAVPQGEPSDAQVEAAGALLYGVSWGTELEDRDLVRDALRAAWGVR